MKIKSAYFKNFAKVSEIKVNFADNVTYLIGENGSGKTTIGLNGIWFIFKGLSQKGTGLIAERFRFIGPYGKSAEGGVVIYDEKDEFEATITRKLLKNKTELKIEASDGRHLGQEYLDEIFNIFLINPLAFAELSSKEQAAQFGIDTTMYDEKKKRLELERRDIGRDVTRLEGVIESAGEPEEVEEVLVSRLMNELDKRVHCNEENKEQKEELSIIVDRIANEEKYLNSQQEEVKAAQDKIRSIESIIKDIKQNITAIRQEYKEKQEFVANLKNADEEEVRGQINAAQETNKKATAYQKFLGAKADHKKELSKYEEKTKDIEEVKDSRNDYLRSMNLPWPNITITEEGEFRLNGKPFSAPYFSTGEILKLGAKIGSKLKDGLKYIWFPNAQQLDDKNREGVFRDLIKEGYQVVAEIVGTKKKKEPSILLREMKAVESYKDVEEKDKLI